MTRGIPLTPRERALRDWSEAAVQEWVRDAAARFGWAYDHQRQTRREVRPGVLVGDEHSRGRPDTFLARPGELLVVECKREVGSKVTPEQTAWLWLYSSLPGVEAWILRPSVIDQLAARLSRRPVPGYTEAPDWSVLIPGRRRGR